MKLKKSLLRIGCAALCLILVCGIAVFGLNAVVIHTAEKYFLTQEEAAIPADFDCILVLGAGVYESGAPTWMLRDRLNTGIALYKAGASSKLLMSGDHGRKSYDEVNSMKDFAINAGVPSEDIFMDHAGFSTYESMYRARDIFQAKRILIVTQRYHLYRAVYVARALGLDAYGIETPPQVYGGETMREIREILARVKDVFTALFKPAPTFLGETIPVSGDGNLTNDK